MDESGGLICDCRDEKSKETNLYRIPSGHYSAEKLTFTIAWWERLVGIERGYLYTVRYTDQNDPTVQQYVRYALKADLSEEVEVLPSLQFAHRTPELYELDSEHHRTVARFLSLELPLACEYTEIQENIIISYYLRSDNGFSRFLLLLTRGKKAWKIQQDRSMKGFSSGAFFVVNDRLIFIRERNEVCIYDL